MFGFLFFRVVTVKVDELFLTSLTLNKSFIYSLIHLRRQKQYRKGLTLDGNHLITGGLVCHVYIISTISSEGPIHFLLIVLA